MITCPICGFRNLTSNARCLKCQALLAENPDEFQAAIGEADRQKGEATSVVIASTLSKIRRKNPLRTFWDIPEGVRYRFPFTSGLMSLIPGLGQTYNHQPAKALIFAAAWWMGFVFSLITIRHPLSNLFLLLLLFGWVLIWNDAVATALRINGEFWSFRNSVALWFAALFAVGVIITGTQLFGANLISLVRILDRAQEPELHYGDIVLTNHMAYWFSDPAPGDVVYYDPEPFKMENTSQGVMALINVKDFYQRISALPGDTVETRGGSILRNGSPISQSHLPFNAAVIPDGESVKIPEKHYWLPITGIPSDRLAAALGAGSPALFEPGWITQGWSESAIVPRSAVRGRGVAVINPPERRRWFGD